MFRCCFFFCKQKTAYEMRISDWSSDVCSSDLMKAWPNAFNSRAARNPLAAYTAVGVVAALLGVPPSLAGTYDLTIGETTINVSGKERTALAINGTVPGPPLRFIDRKSVV